MQSPSSLPTSLPSSAISPGAEARLKQLLPELFDPKPVSGQQFLRIQLSAKLTVAVALAGVEESLQLPAQLITPLPNMADSVIGLMSSKGRDFWADDLLSLLNLPIALRAAQSYEIVVIRTPPDSDAAFAASGGDLSAQAERFLGLIVPQIRGPIRLSSAEITSAADEVEPGLRPFLSGQAVIEDGPVFVLRAEAIGSAASMGAAST
ncbi:MAG: chemotaxis protein CheW [Phormidesmis sp.]